MSSISNRDRIIYSMVQLEILREQLKICCQSGFVEQPNMVDQVHHPGNYTFTQDMDFNQHHFNNQVPPQPPQQANLAPSNSQMKGNSTSKKSKGKKNEVQNQVPQQQFNLNDL